MLVHLRAKLRSQRRACLVLAGLCLLGTPAAADQIELRPKLPDRGGLAQVLYRLDRPLSASGMLVLEWTDQLGRLIERRQRAVGPATGRIVAFQLDMGRAVAMQNTLRGHIVSPDAEDPERKTVRPFTVSPPTRPWQGFQIIAYQPQDSVMLAGLAQLGVSAGKVMANRDDTVRRPVDDAVAPFLGQDLRWYVENIATDFYAAYHRWFADRTVNAAFLDVQSRHRHDPADLTVFFRQPRLSDRGWLAKIHDRLIRTVHDHAPYQPLYYSLADEPGIGDLAAAWDFDLSPESLAGMRLWLHSRYRSLGALNRQWGSQFARWDQVVPMTTDQAMRRGDDNFSAWNDFKAWMDVAFARAVRFGTDAVHAADPHALAAIEGAQVPGWGGYDYTRLPRSVDVMEIYDSGGNVDIARSLDPGLVMLTTSSGGDPAQAHALWRALLRGIRGVILWDENGALVRSDGSLGPWGEQAAPQFATLRGGLGALLINSRPAADAVATLYSPASQRIQWMLDRRPEGAAWADRDAEAETRNDTARAAMDFFTRLVRHMGIEQRFISPEQVAQGALRHGRYRVLILPRALALSAAEAGEIRRFVAQGGTVIADVVPGSFDQHGRRLPHAALADLFAAMPIFGRGRAILYPPAGQSSGETEGGVPEALRQLTELLAQAHVQPVVQVTTPDGNPATDVEIYRSTFGRTTVLALQRDFEPGAAVPVTLTLPRPLLAEDMRDHRVLGVSSRLSLALDPVRPTVLALSAGPAPAPQISAPAQGRAGRDAWISLRMPGVGISLMDLEIRDPAGQPERHYGGRLLTSGGWRRWRLPLALNDPTGIWEIRVTDVASGRQTIAHLDVVASSRHDAIRP